MRSLSATRSKRPTPKSRTACWSALRSVRPPYRYRRSHRPRKVRTMHSSIVGTGAYLPAQVLTNAELARRIDTSDEWVRSRTGIRQRYIAAPDQQTSDLALAASRGALAVAGIAPTDLDLSVGATTTPDIVFLSTA